MPGPSYPSNFYNGVPRSQAVFAYDGHPDSLSQENVDARLAYQENLSSNEVSGPYPTDIRVGRDRIGEGTEENPTDVLGDIKTIFNLLLTEIAGVTTDGTTFKDTLDADTDTIAADSFTDFLYTVDADNVQSAFAAQHHLNKFEGIAVNALNLARQLRRLKFELELVANNEQVDLTATPKYPSDRNQFTPR